MGFAGVLLAGLGGEGGVGKHILRSIHINRGGESLNGKKIL